MMFIGLLDVVGGKVGFVVYEGWGVSDVVDFFENV